MMITTLTLVVKYQKKIFNNEHKGDSNYIDCWNEKRAESFISQQGVVEKSYRSFEKSKV